MCVKCIYICVSHFVGKSLVKAQQPTTTISNLETTGVNVGDVAPGFRCTCACQYVNTSSLLNALQVDLDFIEDLKVSTEDLSSEKRKKISASDPRASSTVIGSFGVVILVTVTSAIVMLDLTPPRRLCVKTKSEKPSTKGKSEPKTLFVHRHK